MSNESSSELTHGVRLDLALEIIAVRGPADHPGPEGWYAVEDAGLGIVAYFLKETDALRYRLDLANRMVNP
jgi:hypothetical protein